MQTIPENQQQKILLTLENSYRKVTEYDAQAGDKKKGAIK